MLGHGDFRKANLFVWAGKVVPIDWMDFGVCDRAYDVGHFVRSIPSAHRDEVLGRYAQETGSDPEALRCRGMIIDSIVRAGGGARLAHLPGQDFDRCARLFAKHVAEGVAALSV